jgi:cysteine-rich repeat protein
MHLTSKSPVRSLWMSLLCVAFVVSATACGPDGDDDDLPPLPDARMFDAGHEPDAPPVEPDAALPDSGVPGVCGDDHQDPGEACDDGNAINGDGCEADCTITPTAEVQCETLPALPSGVCSVTAGDGSKLFKGVVLTPGRVFRGGQVAVNAGGTIMCVGCDCASQVPSATVITCPHGVISPGLINDHDHITFTQNDPYTPTDERYEQRHDWRKGIRGHTKIPSAGTATTEQMNWGELRFLMGGATSIVGSGGTGGFLRNLDRSNTLQEGLNQTSVEFQTFPLDDSAGTQITGTCNYGAMADTEAVLTPIDAYLPHVSEGIDAPAHNEFLCTSSATFDVTAPGIAHLLTGPKSAFIHGIALNAADYALMAQTQTGLIWSPRSNITLYGNTAEVTLADRLGVQIALGTDWMPTGSMSLLRELKCASDYNRIYLGGYFNDEDLWKMVTVTAASLSATDDVIGVLAPGKVADIAIFDGSVNDSFHAVVAAEVNDVALVVRGGKVLYGDDALVASLSAAPTDCDVVTTCDAVTKRVCAFSEIGKHYAELVTAVGSDYPTFFCGEPTNEPSCVPERGAAVAGSTVYTGEISAMDSDGDGILDAADDCPTVFNPVRPLDMGTQADVDMDGLGDVCDPCPFDAGTTTCTVFNPDDADGDGIVSADDNCPSVANADQADGDGDHKGDVCDPCPAEANPGSQGCTTAIYAIKNGTVPVGSTVAIKNALVTGRFGTASSGGAFLQVKEGDAGYMGADFSGIFVFGGNAVAIGDRVDVTTATTAVFSGQIELTGAVMTVTSSGNALPAPIVVLPAAIATGGARAVALESVLVQVADVTVASLDAANFEFIVQDGLRVDDVMFRSSPFPVVGSNFTSVTGVLALRNNQMKIEPRSAADLVVGSATLTGFAPAMSSVNEGDSGVPTAPAPLTVTIAQAVASDTFVSVTSGDPAALTVVGGGVTIPAGQTSAPVLVNGLAASASVTLTATLGPASFQASVRVVGATEVAKLLALTPPMATTTPGGSVTLTVSIDLPAPAGGTVVNLALAPADAGTIPATVTVPAGQQSATFTYVDGSVGASATVTASLDAATFSSTITIVATLGRLVINEVDYDQPSADTAEFVEIYNGTGADVNLTGKSLVLVNGTNGATYATIPLGPAGTLAAGGYLVIGQQPALDAAPAEALKILFTGGVQNGDPDGAALIDTTTNTFIDKLSYGGSILNATIAGLGTGLSLVEGTATTAKDVGSGAGAIARNPNGADTDNAATDWAFTTTPTPGAANIP